MKTGLFVALFSLGALAGCGGTAADVCSAEASCASPSTKKYKACCTPGTTKCYYDVGGTKINYDSANASEAAMKVQEACK